MRIAIIGGGLTGLSAAYKLSKNMENQVTVFEKESDVGGLVSGFEIAGTTIEKTYHHIFKTDTFILDLIGELELSSKLNWYNSSIAIYYDGKISPFTGVKDLLLFNPLNILSKLSTGLATLYLQKTSNWKQFINVSAWKWLRKYMGTQATEVIWEPLLKGKFHNYYKEISMSWFWARIHIRANSRDGIFSTEKLAYMDGGFNEIVENLKIKLIESGVKLYTSTPINKAETNKNKIEIEYNMSKQTKKETFDKVLFTTPTSVFAKYFKQELSEKEFQALQKVKYLGAICMVFTSSQKIGNYYWLNVNDSSSPFLVFINHTNLVGKQQYNGTNVYYIGTYIPQNHDYFKISDKELQNIWFDGVKQIYPEFNTNSVSELKIFRFPFAQHVVDTQYSEYVPSFKTAIKNVYLANFSQLFPEERGINFSVRDGFRVASLIDQDIASSA